MRRSVRSSIFLRSEALGLPLFCLMRSLLNSLKQEIICFLSRRSMDLPWESRAASTRLSKSAASARTSLVSEAASPSTPAAFPLGSTRSRLCAFWNGLRV